uniref:Uncharacterized protein n=1 Tax=Arion vulgaris TaxID=1028688 RepID=A0A0B7A5X1_9EUPU
MATQLKDKVAVVTGSSSGLGEAIAILFASRGAKVTLCGRDEGRLKSVLEKAVKASGGHHDRFLTVQGDLNEASVRKQIIDQTGHKFGRLDILVANAGVLRPNQSLLTATEETYDDIMNTNLKSVFFLIQQAVPLLEKSKGNIINISTAGYNLAIPMLTLSLLSKVALDHLTRCLAVDLGSKGIRVNSANPGQFATRVLRHVAIDTEATKGDATQPQIDVKQPLKGKLGTVEDFAEAVAFLASDQASFITGEALRVDGGRSFGGGYEELVLK